MIKNLSVCALVAYTNAIKLSAELQADWAIDQTFYTDDDSVVQAALADFEANGNQYNDLAFPPNSDSLGPVNGDTARYEAGDVTSNGISWKRASELYPEATKVMFSIAPKAYSNMMQGELGDCYALSVFVSLDARPGALEELFLTTTVNGAGVYAMYFYQGGIRHVVTVDDFIPVKDVSGYGSAEPVWVPPFAKSSVEGEIWPMIIEKLWAKLKGSYSYAESGSSAAVLAHLTNDPAEQFNTQMSNYPSITEAWQKVKAFTARDYFVLGGTAAHAWVPGHAYSLLSA